MGLFTGAGAFFDGVRFIAASPKLWWRALVPAFVALAVAVGLGFVGIHVALGWVHRSFGDGVGGKIIAMMAIVVVVLMATLVAVSMAPPLSGWALEGIVRARARALGVEPPVSPRGIAAALRSTASSLAALALGLLVLAGLTLTGWLVPPAVVATIPAKIAVTALLLAYDLLDYPFAFFGMPMVARLGWCARHWGAVLGFGLAAMAFFVIPGVGLLALPCGVAGATRLMGESEITAKRDAVA